jgi:hypothetical protein
MRLRRGLGRVRRELALDLIDELEVQLEQST